MKRRRIIVLAVAVALAFAASGGPRHAQAATQGHPAATGSAHDHAQQSGDKHSHDHGAAAASQFGEGGKHDHAGTPPAASNQGCCYAWCNSVAVIHAAHGLVVVTPHDEHFSSNRPFRIAAFPSLIDPPPR